MRSSSLRTRHVVLATGILVLGIAPFGIAATGDALREGVRNGTATKETEIVSNNATGVTRPASPTSPPPAAARSTAAVRPRAAPPPTRPRTRASAPTTCPRASRSSSTPRARERRFDHGRRRRRRQEAVHDQRHGRRHRPERRPGRRRRAAALKSRWLLVNEAGQIEEQSGGFTILDAYQTNQNVYIDSGASLEGKGLQATIAIQNKIDTGGDRTRRRRTSRARSASLAARPSRSSARRRAPRRRTRSCSARVTAAATRPTARRIPRKRVYIQITE